MNKFMSLFKVQQIDGFSNASYDALITFAYIFPTIFL